MAWRASVLRFRRAMRYVAVTGLSALLALPAVYVVVLVLVLSLVGPGLLLLPRAVRVVRRGADAHHRRAAAWLGTDGTDGPAATGTVPAGVRAVLRDRATYAAVAWLVLHAVTGVVAGALALGLCVGAVSWATTPLWWWVMPGGAAFAVWRIDSWGAAVAAVAGGAAYAALAVFAVPLLAGAHARMTRAVLRPRPGKAALARRVEELAASRAEALDAHAAELRRIERDLHDGAQAGLVAVSLRLGLMRQAMRNRPEELPEVLPEMIERTQELAEQALAQLRRSVRAVYPPVLGDQGLAGAARSLVAACPVPAELDTGQDDDAGPRAPAAVEAAAYFVLSEALTNVARHSGATCVRVRLRTTGASVVVSVRDDGRGGAVEGAGTGLPGIRRRVAAFDGTTELSSPPGGPTELRVELPCGS
ncbi:histidine kinase [Streptomyces mashuensis]|uniref:histidine kinase n=1 Tax=Streptomyces mashuensis TaxID=33904 RepID=A0A919B4A4_9ACTN|nr:sensor histidine kinase [Streptomyces mashuensis]GHF52787.1 histidine kinase [Streptomyces mashuensis]